MGRLFAALPSRIKLSGMNEELFQCERRAAG